MKTLAVLLTTLLPLMVACSSNDDGKELEVKGKGVDPVGKIEVPVTPGVVELTDSQRVMVKQGNEFSFHLLQTVNNVAEGSYVMSPLSVGYVLGMLNNAADEQSRQEIMQVLGFGDATPQAVNDYFSNMLVNAPGLDDDVTLEVSNAIFGNSARGIQFTNDFTALMEGYYQAGIESLDFTDVEATLGRINGWSKEKSHGMIPQILDEISSGALTYLLNAVYFNAPWTNEFNGDSHPETFYTLGGTKQLPMMHTTDRMYYTESEDIKMVCKSYANGKFRMAVLLPANGGSADGLVNSLTATRWQQLVESMNLETVMMSMPSFNSKTDIDLIPVMKAMGMNHVFDGGDFSSMLVNGGGAVLTMLKQKAAINVTEKGTEASAVTIGGVETCANPDDKPEYIIFNANSPFVYVLFEQTTGAIFFMGKFTGE